MRCTLFKALAGFNELSIDGFDDIALVNFRSKLLVKHKTLTTWRVSQMGQLRQDTLLGLVKDIEFLLFSWLTTSPLEGFFFLASAFFGRAGPRDWLARAHHPPQTQMTPHCNHHQIKRL